MEKGLTGGENVIIDGLQKVRPGETVKATVQQPGSQPTSGPASAAAQAEAG